MTFPRELQGGGNIYFIFKLSAISEISLKTSLNYQCLGRARELSLNTPSIAAA